MYDYNQTEYEARERTRQRRLAAEAERTVFQALARRQRRRGVRESTCPAEGVPRAARAR